MWSLVFHSGARAGWSCSSLPRDLFSELIRYFKWYLLSDTIFSHTSNLFVFILHLTLATLSNAVDGRHLEAVHRERVETIHCKMERVKFFFFSEESASLSHFFTLTAKMETSTSHRDQKCFFSTLYSDGGLFCYSAWVCTLSLLSVLTIVLHLFFFGLFSS